MDYSSRIFFDHLAQTSLSPLAIPIERSKGIYLYGPDGKRYMDLISGVGVNNIGHSHPSIIKAIKEQLDKHLHVMVYGEYIQSATNELAKYVVSLLPNMLDCCYFVNSGAEANEGALKLAKCATGRTEIVSCHDSYHGSTYGALSVSGNNTRRNRFLPLLPDIQFIRFGNIHELSCITQRTACVIMETIQSDAGVIVPPRDYLQAVRKQCDDTGTLLILDEIQCGMGRTGTLFAFEQFGIIPDILTVAKAFGGGLPLGAFIANKKLMNCFLDRGTPSHLTTFGGNPVACAAGLATLRVIQEEGLLESVEQKGKLFERHLAPISGGDTRRAGLMMACDFASSNQVKKIVNGALKKGVICFYFLSRSTSLRLAPPLTITEQEIEEGCTLLVDTILNVTN